ncbi:P-loop containing nucleoside triphosphate hydrolase protein [Pelagophyceae sp. CCMP2097]|nr:P-loop containing nucleoside triphosphate hydrolase protein [Pelagophyceae sp. CCMP2097]
MSAWLSKSRQRLLAAQNLDSELGVDEAAPPAWRAPETLRAAAERVGARWVVARPDAVNEAPDAADHAADAADHAADGPAPRLDRAPGPDSSDDDGTDSDTAGPTAADASPPLAIAADASPPLTARDGAFPPPAPDAALAEARAHAAAVDDIRRTLGELAAWRGQDTSSRGSADDVAPGDAEPEASPAAPWSVEVKAEAAASEAAEMGLALERLAAWRARQSDNATMLEVELRMQDTARVSASPADASAPAPQADGDADVARIAATLAASAEARGRVEGLLAQTPRAPADEGSGARAADLPGQTGHDFVAAADAEIAELERKLAALREDFEPDDAGANFEPDDDYAGGADPRATAPAQAPLVVVIGPCGVGKTTIGRAVAERLRCEFLDADDLHPAANTRKMANGEPLNDDDRGPWLRACAAALQARAGTGCVLACSALKRAYRDALSDGLEARLRLVVVHLDAGRAVVRARAAARQGHFMPAALVDSQFEIFQVPAADESPSRTLISVDASQPLETIVDELEEALSTQRPRPDFEGSVP